MKSTILRLREALSDHFGPEHIRSLKDADPLFPNTPLPDCSRCLGDADDRHEMLGCVDVEFGIHIPDAIAHTNPTIESLARLVDVMVASRDTSGN